MFCPQYPPERWLAYLHHQLDEKEQKAMEHHLEHCPDCLAELLEQNRLEARMEAAKPVSFAPLVLRDVFSLSLEGVRETMETLVGVLRPCRMQPVRSGGRQEWEYVSRQLGIRLVLGMEENGFSLEVYGIVPMLTLRGEKELWSGRVDERMIFSHLAYGSYEIRTEKGSVNFNVHA